MKQEMIGHGAQWTMARPSRKIKTFRTAQPILVIAGPYLNFPWPKTPPVNYIKTFFIRRTRSPSPFDRKA